MILESVKVSIIIPVYNTPEKELRKCIESTISQTIEGVEVIIVDDGSKEATKALCDEYVNRNNVTIIHKENGGLSAARNTGYYAAKGKWITFVDADDWIELNTCELLIKIAEQNDLDVLLFGTTQEIGNYCKNFKYKIKSNVLYQDEDSRIIQEQILDFDSNIATAWAKLIKKDLLDKYNIEHDVLLRQGSEGIEFNLRLFEKAHRVMLFDYPLYHYVFNPNSISAKHDENNHLLVIKCFEKMKTVILKYNNPTTLLNKLYTRMLYVIVSAAITGYFSPNNKIRYREKCDTYSNYLKNEFVKEAILYGKTDCLDRKRKIIIWCIKHQFYFLLLAFAKIRYRQKNKK